MADGQPEEKPQGPTDPSGPGGLDAPAPPGGPQRTDTPSGDRTPGDPAPDPGPAATRVTRDGDEGEAHEPDRSGHGQDRAAREAQEENAETSLDQPSQ